MVEKLRIKDVDVKTLLASFFDAENPFAAVRERLPRLQEVHARRKMQKQAPQSLLDEVRIAIHIRPGKG